MNLNSIPWGLVSVIIQLLVAAYVYGRLTERVKGIIDRTATVEKTVLSHANRLSDHGERLGRLEGRRDQ